MMMNIKKVLLLLILAFNIIFTQYPSASFEFSHYSFDENLERASVTLQIENPDLMRGGTHRGLHGQQERLPPVQGLGTALLAPGPRDPERGARG